MPAPNQLELETLWTTQGITGVNYNFGDRVASETGEEGVIIALLSLDPEPVYLIELSSGKSLTVIERNSRSLGENTGRKLIIRTL